MNALFSLGSLSAAILGSVVLASGFAVASGGVAAADVPDPVVATEFHAEECPGDTMFRPTNNAGFAIPDTTLVFEERLISFNGGHIVPLYDFSGGTTLVFADGSINGSEPADAPLCGVRYVKATGTAVSEWMFCTDREAMTCGDTDLQGNLVDKLGTPINPMVGVGPNHRLTNDQAKLIAYLVQYGHSYEGVGSQFWGGVTEARSGGTSNERAALQTLVWCISDPVATSDAFLQTCEQVLPAAEQARLHTLIPDAPELALSPSSGVVEVGTAARFTVTTNVYNQSIDLVSSGDAVATWTVCEGDAALTGSTLTVAGDSPEVATSVVLCAQVTSAGAVTLDASAAPPSTKHIGWSQSNNNPLSGPCQVYATYHAIDQVVVDASASVAFVVPTAPTPTVPDPQNELAASGGNGVNIALVGLLIGLLATGAALFARGRQSPLTR